MKYISICSGIEAASVAWEPLGWQPVAFAEIEPFPSAVLAHHYPDVPNVGDITKVNWAQFKGQVDVIIGGTPCQSWSVAGNRKGFNDDRGRLTYTFVDIISKVRPSFFVWENVPGIVSIDKGESFQELLKAFQELGYIIDVDIYDAQFFGVPQRRKRIFLCGISVDYLVNMKTITSFNIITNPLLKILQDILIELQKKSDTELLGSTLLNLLSDGLQKRINFFFSSMGKESLWLKLLPYLTGMFQKFQQEQENSEVKIGEKAKGHLKGEVLRDVLTEFQSTLTEKSWKNTLEDLCYLQKLFITSTEIKPTIKDVIFCCSKIVLNMQKFIMLLMAYCPNSLEEDMLNLTVLQEYTRYARLTNSSLLGDFRNSAHWSDFQKQAENIFFLVGHSTDWRCAAKVLFERDSLQGDITQSGGERESVAGKTERGIGETIFDEGIGFETYSSICTTLRASHAKQPPVIYNETGHSKFKAEDVCGTLRASGGSLSGGSEAIVYGGEFNNYKTGKTVKTLTCKSHSRDEILVYENNPTYGRLKQVSVCPTVLSRYGTGGNQIPLVLPINTQSLLRNFKKGDRVGFGIGENGDPANTLQAAHSHGVFSNNIIRRLTPLECERLQGFPDGWTRIPYRKKSAEDCPDSPRYKAIGNSMAVPVVRWIGERIQGVNNVTI